MSATSATPLAQLGQRYFEIQHSYDPYNATLLGISEFDHLSFNPSIEASQHTADQLDSLLAEVEALDTSQMTEPELLDRQVLAVLVWGAASDARHSQWAANASAKGYVSRQGLIFQAIPAMTTSTPESEQRYLSRMELVAATFDQLGVRYQEEKKRGRLSTRVGLEHSLQQLEDYQRVALADDNVLKPTVTSPDPVRQQALTLLRDQIRPAMARLADLIRTDLLPDARDDEQVGISRVRGGEAIYHDAVRRHTTTSLSPADIHQRGLDFLANQRPRFSELGARALGTSDFAQIAERLRTDLTLRFSTSQEIVAIAQATLDRAEAARPQAFPDFKISPCVIEEIDPLEAEHAALAYYRPPSHDGSRPGAHCLLTANPSSRYIYEYEALAFHESTPGHHLQLATAQTLDIPRYRRHLDVELCAFIEGWGLYSEQLADDLGLYSSDLQRLGMLSFAALRACRLVIDTGLHYYGWSRQQAQQFMWENTVTTEANVRNEVDRYIAWPGQALAYMIGCQEIVRLRTESQQVLGQRFSLVDFHQTVLSDGAVPLSVLAESIARWQSKTT